MKIERVLVTPKMAAKLLQNNDKNRSIKAAVVEKYVKEMNNGHWREDTAETIKIAKDGRLLDGQHRLAAIVKAGKSFHFHIASEMESDVFDVLDTGSKRRASDVFHISGIKYDKTLPSIISAWYAITEGRSTTTTKVSNRPSNSELLEFYNDNQQFWEHVAEKARHWYRQFGKIITPAMFGAFYAHFHIKDADMAMQFMQAIADGISPPHISAVLFRNKMIENHTSIRKLPIGIKDALIIKAWNAYRSGQQLKKLTFDPSREDFPTAL